MKLDFILKSLFILIITAGKSFAQQQPPITKDKFHWGRTGNENSGYVQAVKTGNVLYISGTVAHCDSTMDVQVKGVYERIEATLKNYGLNFQHVVKENLFTTDMEGMIKHNEIRKQFYKKDWPAATWLEIKRLYLPTCKLEVEVIAHFPN
jgi:2-iminobutanoate/2-iminopropanoate deaminase